MGSEEKQTKAARNQMLFRSVNERIHEISDGGVPPNETTSFLCECADTSCMKTLELTASEYEAAHSSPTRFPILPGHELPDVERVVEQHDGYIVVEKFGQAAATVEAAEVAGE
jgi:hypothetical protein